MADSVLERKEGWQTIVEIFENYVLKYLKSKEQMRDKIREHLVHKSQLHLLEERIESVHSSIYKSLRIVHDSEVPINLLANAIIKDNIIKQDRVVLVKERLDKLMKKGDVINAKRVIEKLIDFIISLWKYGIHENTYKFYSAYGIDNKGKIVLIDFLEITNKEESVKKQINNRKWDKPRRYFGKVEKELAEYFITLANEKLNYGAFKKYWGTNETNFGKTWRDS